MMNLLYLLISLDKVKILASGSQPVCRVKNCHTLRNVIYGRPLKMSCFFNIEL